MREERAVVFVIDDDASLRGALHNLLSSVGLDVPVFASPQEFLHAKRPDAPGCILLDLRLRHRGNGRGTREMWMQAILR